MSQILNNSSINSKRKYNQLPPLSVATEDKINSTINNNNNVNSATDSALK